MFKHKLVSIAVSGLCLIGLMSLTVQSASAAEPCTVSQDANLSGCDFAGRDFFNYVVDRSNFTGANLTDVSARYSYWDGTILDGANLTGVNFYYAWMRGASFKEANLTGANLANVALTDADLTDAVMTGVISGGTHGVPLALPTGWVLRSGFLLGPTADLRGANLSGVDLTGADLSSAQLEGVRSGGIIGTPAHLPEHWGLLGGYLFGPGADLSGAKLDALDIWAVDLTGATLTGASINQTSINNSNLTRIKSGGLVGKFQQVTGARVQNGYILVPTANLAGADLRNADLSNLNLSEANLSGARLSGANLHNTSLSSADLTGADFSGADLSNAWLGSAKAVNARFTNAYMSSVNLDQADLSRAHLLGADLKHASLGTANLAGADFSNTNLSNAWLGKASAVNANFTKANMASVWLDESDLSGALFRSADLNHASMPVANLADADFSSANLTDTWLGSANISQCNFSNADLSRAWLQGNMIAFSKFFATKLSSANLSGVHFVSSEIYSSDLEATNLADVVLISTRSGDLEGLPSALPSNLQIIDGEFTYVFTTALRPTISGTAKTAATISASVADLPGSAQVSYQWLRNSLPIQGANTATYLVTANDVSQNISVVATVSQRGYQSSVQVSEALLPVKSDMSVGTVNISGVMRSGKIIKAFTRPWVSTVGVKIKYQWLRNGKEIKYATKSTYKLTDADAGMKISVKVSQSLNGYNSAIKTSASRKVLK